MMQYIHRYFEIDTDYGPARVLGDPAMSEETREALRQMAILAFEAMLRGELGKRAWDEFNQDN